MEEKMLELLAKLAEKNGYEKVILNYKREKPLIIEGIKGSFIPEVLFLKGGEIKALASFVKDLEEVETIHKLTLFIDYVSKKGLRLYIIYDSMKILQEELIKKLKETDVKLYENICLIKV